MGKYNAICGNSVIKIIQITIQKKNGTILLNISTIGTSVITLDIAKTLIPIGGVMTPISIVMTHMTPNQIEPESYNRGKYGREHEK